MVWAIVMEPRASTIGSRVNPFLSSHSRSKILFTNSLSAGTFRAIVAAATDGGQYLVIYQLGLSLLSVH